MITPIWKAGAALGNTKEWDDSLNLTASTTEKKTGAYSYRFSSTGWARKYTSLSQFRSGAWLWPISNLTNLDTFLFGVYEGSTQLSAISLDNDGTQLKLIINGTTTQTIVNPLTFGEWCQVGIDFKQSGWLSFYLNGVEVLSYTGAITGTVESLYFYFTGSYTYLDDLYLDATPGEASPACPPDKRFLWAPATSDVAANWTPSTGASHFAVVDEVPVSGTDFLSATSAGLVDTFGVTVPTLPTGFVPGAVWPVATAFKSDGATATQLTLRTTDGVATIDGTSLDLPTTAGLITERFGTQPDGSAWTNAAVAATKYGIVSSGTF